MQRIYFLLLFFPIACNLILAQSAITPNYFDSPIKKPIKLIGNFGEIRPNHFHSGFDISTDGKEGEKVYAVADGYVSRIKISAKGYGKALYINHPNGYTSVYAHLKQFNSSINNLSEMIQYAFESFEVDTLLKENIIEIKKGDFIGYSGNSGGSEGPHLHFEIRETISEEVINPFKAGIIVADNTKPIINRLVIYQFSNTNDTYITSRKINTKINCGNCKLAPGDTISVSEYFAFGIDCFDTQNASSNKNAIYSMELIVDGIQRYIQKFDKFHFDNSRYVNTHIDYAEKQESKMVIQKLFASKNNNSGIYITYFEKGRFLFKENSFHSASIVVKDFNGNTSKLNFYIMQSKEANKTKSKKENQFDCSKENVYESNDIKLVFPPNTFYDDIKFEYNQIQNKKYVSNIFSVLSRKTAVQNAFEIAIKSDKFVTKFKSKYIIASINENGKNTYEGGVVDGDWIKTKTKVLGKFALMIDTVSPIINSIIKLNEKREINLVKQPYLDFLIQDELAGINYYKVLVDNKWILADYDAKNNLLRIETKKLEAGKHSIVINVIDNVGNSTTWTGNIVR